MKTTTLRVQLTVFLALSLLVLWGVTLFVLQRAETNALEGAELQTRSVAHAFAENSLSTIKRVDFILNELANTWVKRPADFVDEVRRYQQDLADVSIQFSITDKTGWIVFSNLPLPSQGMSLADREHVRVHFGATKSALFISAPVLGRLSGKWSLQFSRPLFRHGAFDGVIVISVSPELFSRFYRTLSPGLPGITVMVRDGGALMTRAPDWERYMGQSILNTPYLRDNAPLQGNFLRPSQLDGTARLYGYFRLPEQHLTVVTGLPATAILAPVHAQRQTALGVAAAISLLLLGMALMILRNVTARERATAEVRALNDGLERRVAERTAELAHTNAALSMAASVFHNTMEGVMITNMDGVILSVNPAFTEITGYRPEEAIGKTPNLLRSDQHGEDFYRQLWQTLQRDGAWQGEIWNRRKNGQAYLEWLSIRRIEEETASPARYLSVFHDITEMRRKDEHIHHLAFHDALTGLPNRTLLQDRLSHAMVRAQREGRRMSVMFIDIDRFKAINDSLGHNVGDLLLQEIALRIGRRLRNMDTVARMGGDEFVVLMEDLKEPESCACLAQDLIAEISRPMTLGKQSVQVSASMGMAFFPDDGTDPLELMRRADTAMYAAKSAGRNTYRFFQPDMLYQTQRRLQLEMELRRAIKDGSLELLYQPKVSLRSGALEGVEALLYWRHPQKGLVPPQDFIPVAEESDLIVDIGNWVLEEACRQLSAWQARGLMGLRIAVNVSARQLTDELVSHIAALTTATGIAPRDLEIELTESVVMANPQDVAEILGRLRAIGVTVAIDDFGTGYSSLAYLRRLPIDVLKIDRSFVMVADENDEDAQIVRTILGLSRVLKLMVVAEGVEKLSQAQLLHDLGCDMAQGYFYSPPLSAKDFEAGFPWHFPMPPVAADSLQACSS